MNPSMMGTQGPQERRSKAALKGWDSAPMVAAEQGRRICLFRHRLRIYFCHFGLKKINCASAHNYIITLYSNISRLQNDS